MPPRPIKQEPSTSNSLPSPSTDSPLPSPLPASSNYTDFVLRSTAPSSSSGWKHNIMKFVTVGERVVDPAKPDAFTRPVKLNRKDPRTVRRLTDEDRERHNVRAMQRAAAAKGTSMDVDVKSEVKGEEDEKPGASVKAEKEELDLSLVGKGTSGLIPSARQRGGGGMFKKKTRRVYVSSEEARRLKREEWQPWVLEDDEGHERWIGRMEGGAGEMDTQGGGSGGGAAAEQGKLAQGEKEGTGLKGWRPAAAASDAGGGGSSYVAFVFGDNGDEFQVVPIHRWYKFNQGPKYLTLAEEEAEEEYNRQQKSKEAERWIMHRRAAPPSTSGSSTPQPSTSASQPSVSAAALRSRMMAKSAAGIRVDGADDVRGRPRVRTVISTGDAGNGAKGGKRRDGQEQEQGDDEFDYEEDFQDDEEGIAKIDDLADEEETKELEERIRREMRGAERPDTIPDDDEDDEIDALTNTGRELKKLVKKSDKSGAYESDEDENPYASSDEDDTASITSDSRPAPSSRQSSPQPPSARAHSPSRGASHSRHASPSTGAGSALVAKRATSPSGRSSRGPSPGPSSGKRKRTADGAGSDSDLDGTKRRKNLSSKAKSPSPGADVAGLLTKADLVAYLKTRPNQTSTTKEVLTHFRKALKSEPGNKAAIGGLLKAVANFVEGTLVLKPGL